uniref:Acyl-coenzyme A oxidase n=1 Tax=Colletotrichum fructicola (strain Nara gc5) TaxID=1213859 RepID=L2GBA4_COLFN
MPAALKSISKQALAMANARSRTSFDVEKLTNLIYGGASVVRARRAAWARVEKALGTDDTSRLPGHYAKTSREDLYLDGLRMGRAVWEDRRTHNHAHFDWLTPRYTLFNYSPFGLSPAMFVKMLQLMATPAQQARWLAPALAGRINGAYWQTELGHGTFVRGLETVAEFDPATDEFVIRSPGGAASTKFWPGSLAFSASHAIVMARLVTRGRDEGVHPFMVQLRDVETGRPVEGVELGDIGVKMSHNQNDNGFVRFEGVRVPRGNMLMAQAAVGRDGVYERREGTHEKAAYGTMMVTRSKMTWVNGVQLAAAATIATRYSTVRVQGTLPFGKGDDEEVPLTSFRSQHFRLLTLVAKAYGILFASKYTEEVHREFERRSEEGDFSTMTDAHALISGMKAWSSAIASEGTEDARRACGGQGYLVTSGLPELVQTSAMMCTGEGDTHVLFQQLARYLMKYTGFAGRAGEQALPADLRYLAAPYTRRCTEADFRDPRDEKTQLLIFQHRAQRLVDRAARGLRRGVEKGKTKGEAWNECVMGLMSAARAHTEYLILRQFVGAVEKVEDEELKCVLEKLRSVFALSTIVNPQSADALTFVEDGFLSEEQLDEIRHTLGRLLDELLPDAIGLTDAWDFTDAGLGSAIGRKDGEAHETLMSWTRQLPINKMVKKNGGVHPEAWRKYIRPALKGVEEDKKESGGSGIEFTPYEREHQVMMAGKAAEVL